MKKATSISSKDTAVDCIEILRRIRHLLPTQGPLKDFVHHNTLHAFQSMSFHEGIAEASRIFGASGYMPLKWYQAEYRKGNISEKILQEEMARYAKGSEEEASRIRSSLFGAENNRHQKRGLRNLWIDSLNIELDVLVHPQWIRMVSKFLDQGIAVWRMPHAPRSFFEAFRKINEESFVPFVPLNNPLCQSLISRSPKEIIEACLALIVGKEEFYETYLTEMLLAHPGWSGMVAFVEDTPQCLLASRKISLDETVAFELLLEVGWLNKVIGKQFSTFAEVAEVQEKSPEVGTERENLQRIWQDAFERSQYDLVLRTVSANAKRGLQSPRNASAQVFFCIDDREGSIRRHLEEIDPTLETYGTPGFYAVDFLFQGLDDGFPVQHCPVVIKPKHIVREAPRTAAVTPRAPKLRQLLQFDAHSNTIFRGWLITQFLGFGSAIRMAMNVFFPSNSPAQASSLSQVHGHSRLHLLRVSDEPTKEGYLLGYSLPEMADRVKAVLLSIGLVKDWAPFVIAFAHGSSSTNNPHFAAYDCGACGGKPGGANARAFAEMANLSDVRKLLKTQGIDIPSSTIFIGAVHDTARDEARYFDLEYLPEEKQTEFARFQKTFELALKRNAKERCRRFDMVPLDSSEDAALREVRRRSAAIFEVRPEMNHATHFAGIVGRRNLTRAAFLDRRVFLNSYDPKLDPNGDILARILSAFIPVCGGITSEYYFSRVDPEKYGAGTKLPHNVVGLMGVSNGVDGDLRTGLPTQMTEIHDPLRLLVLVEQTPDIALSAVKRNPGVYEWVNKEWIRYACIHPTEKTLSMYRDGAFSSWVDPGGEVIIAAQSIDLYNECRGNAVFGLLEHRETK